MKNRIMGMGLAGLMLAGGIVAGAAVPASATYGGETCTPSDAWVEVVEVPAVGEPKITVTNPDYKPAVPAVTDIVKHPAETKVVEHAAEGYTEYHFAKFTRERTRSFSIYGWSAWTDYGAWSKYSPETHTSWQQNTNPIGSPQFHSSGDRNWGTVQWERQWQAQYDGQSRWVETKAAWSETVETKPAWDETVIVTPEIPAVGTETIEVNNPDYIPATTRNINHPAVTCPAPPAHNANGEASCGVWDITLYNQQAEGYENQTASFVVYIDGEFDNAYAVPGGEMQTISGTFEEDSGQHSVIVRTGAAQGDEFVFRLDEIKSDCVTPPVTEEPEEPTTPTTPSTPVTPEKPAPAPVKAAVVAPTADALATTGGDPMGTLWGLTLAALLLASGAGATVLGIRRHQVKNQ